MSNKDTAFYRGNTAIQLDFSAEEISSDGAVLRLEKLLKQRVYTLMQGYEDANDVQYLKNDPILKDILDGELASQPTISRMENSLDKHSIFALCYAWVSRYVSLLQGRDRVVIDIDSTDDPTHGSQQLSMFNVSLRAHTYCKNQSFIRDC